MEPLTGPPGASEALTWEAPGPGDWWQVREHVPYAVSRLFGGLFPIPTKGWKLGAARYGLPTGEPRWATVNSWIYYGPQIPLTEAELAEREVTATATLETAPWRDEVQRWHDDERPRVVTANRALQAVDLAALDEDELVAHVGRAIDHYLTAGSLHFEHTGFDVAAGYLLTDAASWGIDADALIPLLGGASPGSAAADAHYRTIGEALDRAGVDATPRSLDAIRAAGPEVAAALDAFLLDYGYRPLAGHDLLEPTLAERPDLIVASLDARRRRPPVAHADDAADAIRAALEPDQRERFDTRLADARRSYALRDDDVGVCWNWPIGLVRRAVLELGARLVARGALEDATHLFEADADEIAAVSEGRPDGAELARRAADRLHASSIAPPPHLAGGTGPNDAPSASVAADLPPHVAALAAIQGAVWSAAPAPVEAPLHGVGIGTEAAVGPARIVRRAEDVLLLEPGDVLVAPATTAAFNAVFPLLAAVVTEHGGWLSHAAILSREVGLPAVVGVADVFAHVTDGDLLEVDPVIGSVRVVRSG